MIAQRTSERSSEIGAVEPHDAQPQQALGQGLSAADVALKDARVEQRDRHPEDHRALSEAEQCPSKGRGDDKTDGPQHERVQHVGAEPDPEAGDPPLDRRRGVTRRKGTAALTPAR